MWAQVFLSQLTLDIAQKQKFQEPQLFLPLGILLILPPPPHPLSSNPQAPLSFGGQVANCLWDLYVLWEQPHWGQMGLPQALNSGSE